MVGQPVVDDRMLVGAVVVERSPDWTTRVSRLCVTITRSGGKSTDGRRCAAIWYLDLLRVASRLALVRGTSCARTSAPQRCRPRDGAADVESRCHGGAGLFCAIPSGCCRLVSCSGSPHTHPGRPPLHCSRAVGSQMSGRAAGCSGGSSRRICLRLHWSERHSSRPGFRCSYPDRSRPQRTRVPRRCCSSRNSHDQMHRSRPGRRRVRYPRGDSRRPDHTQWLVVSAPQWNASDDSDPG